MGLFPRHIQLTMICGESLLVSGTGPLDVVPSTFAWWMSLWLIAICRSVLADNFVYLPLKLLKAITIILSYGSELHKLLVLNKVLPFVLTESATEQFLWIIPPSSAIMGKGEKVHCP